MDFGDGWRSDLRWPIDIHDFMNSPELVVNLGVRSVNLNPSDITEIWTGYAGYRLLSDTCYKDVVDLEGTFDPVMTNALVNPILPSGYKLSSYLICVYVGDKLVKLIPKNPKDDLRDNESDTQ